MRGASARTAPFREYDGYWAIQLEPFGYGIGFQFILNVFTIHLLKITEEIANITDLSGHFQAFEPQDEFASICY